MAELTEYEKKQRKRAVRKIQEQHKALGIDLKYTQALRIYEAQQNSSDA